MRKRLFELDRIRTLAILCVVFCHAFEAYRPLSGLASYESAGFWVLAFNTIASIIGRLGVPLFLFLSGYLLLNRDFDKKQTVNFYKKSLLPMLLCWEIWIVLLNIFIGVNGEGFDFWRLFRNMLFLEGVNIGMAWYMPVIIGIYLFIPLIAKVLRSIDGKMIFGLAVMVFANVFIVPSLSHVTDSALGVRLYNILNLSFGGGIFGFYLIVGYLLNRYREAICGLLSDRKFKLALYGLLLLYAAFSMYYSHALFSLDYNHLYWYDYFPVTVIAVIVFCLMMSRKVREGGRKFYVLLSECAFGIYLVHQPIQIVLDVLMRRAELEMFYVWKMLVLTVMSFVLSLAFVALVSKSKKLGQLLFLRK